MEGHRMVVMVLHACAGQWCGDCSTTGYSHAAVEQLLIAVEVAHSGLQLVYLRSMESAVSTSPCAHGSCVHVAQIIDGLHKQGIGAPSTICDQQPV